MSRYDAAVQYAKNPYITLLPPKHKGQLQTWAHDASDRISKDMRDGGAYSVLARIEAFIFPFLTGASVLQKLGTTLTATTNKLLNHRHKDESPSQELKELVLAVGTMVYSIITWLPSMIDPSILTRDARTDRPKTSVEIQIEQCATERQQLLEQFATERQQLELRAEQASKDALWNVLPTIDSTNIEEVNQLFQRSGFGGIVEVTVEEGPSKEQYALISQHFWGVEEEKPEQKGPFPTYKFEYGKTQCPEILLEEPDRIENRDKDSYRVEPNFENLEFAIRPKGIVTLKIGCDQLSQEELTKLLARAHEVGEIELMRPDLDHLLALDPSSSALAQIHTLTIRDDGEEEEKVVYESEQLTKIAERFKRIACFDLKGCKTNGELETLLNNHIVIYTTFGRRVGFAEAPQEGNHHNNILTQFNAFNKKLFDLVNVDKPHNRRDPVLFSRYLMHPGMEERFHCFDFCVTKLACFRGTTVRESHLKRVLQDLRYNFPNLRVLDLSFCILLDSDIFDHLQQCPVESIYLNGCDAVLARYHKDNPENCDRNHYYQTNNRHYELDLANVSAKMLDLYRKGTQTIRLGESVLFNKKHPDRRYETYEDYVVSTFAEMHKEMNILAKPPHSREGIAVWYTTSNEGRKGHIGGS